LGPVPDQAPVCDAASLLYNVALACDLDGDCVVNGWLRMTLSSDGCLVTLEMTEPDDQEAACVLAAMEAVRCPCQGGTYEANLGQGHTGFGTMFGNNGGPCGGP
jgi:hypothetical protein